VARPERRARLELSGVTQRAVDVLAADRRERAAIVRARFVDAAIVASRAAALEEDAFVGDILGDFTKIADDEAVRGRPGDDVAGKSLFVRRSQVRRDPFDVGSADEGLVTRAALCAAGRAREVLGKIPQVLASELDDRADRFDELRIGVVLVRPFPLRDPLYFCSHGHAAFGRVEVCGVSSSVVCVVVLANTDGSRTRRGAEGVISKTRSSPRASAGRSTCSSAQVPRENRTTRWSAALPRTLAMPRRGYAIGARPLRRRAVRRCRSSRMRACSRGWSATTSKSASDRELRSTLGRDQSKSPIADRKRRGDCCTVQRS
jgi:hypothetical protein